MIRKACLLPETDNVAGDRDSEMIRSTKHHAVYLWIEIPRRAASRNKAMSNDGEC